MRDTKIITLCGSTRFKEDFERVNRELTLMGFIVLSVGVFGHTEEDPISDDEKIDLDNLHKKKIKMSDAIYVINKGGYIGSSTKSEIIYAKQNDIPIFFMEEQYVNVNISSSEIRGCKPVKPKFRNFRDRIKYFFRKEDCSFKYCRKCGHPLEVTNAYASKFGWITHLKCNNCGNSVETYKDVDIFKK